MKNTIFLLRRFYFHGVFLLLATFFGILGIADAQVGLDIVNRGMSDQGLFTPHIDNCLTSEGFVPVGPAGSSGVLGFCIEKNERTAQTWDVARQTCVQQGKRLPEPIEFKTACLTAGTLGLNDMTDDAEWGTNFAKFQNVYAGGVWYQDMITEAVGDGSCKYVGAYKAMGSDAVDHSLAYRCLR